MNGGFEPMVDLTEAREAAYACATAWSLELDTPFAMSNVSFVAPTNDGNVLKSAWPGDDESLHEGDALKLWNGDGAVRLHRRMGRVLLEQRAVPGSDLSGLPNEEATAIAVALALRLWRPARSPFRPVGA
jgi:streptomycin 6-kinase